MRRTGLSTLITALALVGLSAPAVGQVVEILPQIGITTVNYSTDDFDSSTGVGFEAGGKLRVGARFYGEAGIFWSTASADVSETGSDETAGSLRISDIRVPVVIGVKLIKSRVIALRIFGGATPAFVTSVSGEGELVDVTKDDITSTIWAGRAGLGIDFTLISADAGYDFGFSDLSSMPEEGDSTVKRNGFFLEAGLRFGF